MRHRPGRSLTPNLPLWRDRLSPKGEGGVRTLRNQVFELFNYLIAIEISFVEKLADIKGTVFNPHLNEC